MQQPPALPVFRTPAGAPAAQPPMTQQLPQFNNNPNPNPNPYPPPNPQLLSTPPPLARPPSTPQRVPTFNAGGVGVGGGGGGGGSAIKTMHELLSSSEQLKQYIPAFLEAGVDDLPFLLGETRPQWDIALDSVRDHARQMGIELRAGHRMQIISLLNREKAAEEAARSGAVAIGVNGGMGGGLDSTGLQPPLIRDITTAGSPNRRMGNTMRQADVLANPETQQSSGDDISVCLAGCNRMCGTTRMHWLCCFGFALFTLLGSVFLFEMYTKLKDDDVNDASDPQPDGGWEFVRLLYIFGFTTCSVLFCCCGWVYCRNPGSRGVTCPDACSHANCNAADCNFGCPALNFDCCSGGGPSPDCSCPALSCAGCDLPQCSGGGCPECDLPRCGSPSCDCNCLPDNCGSGIGECCQTVYKIVCCQCKIQVG